MNAFSWKKAGIAALSALIALQSLWMVTERGMETASAAAQQREWQLVGSGAVGERSEYLDIAIHNHTPYIIYTLAFTGRQLQAKKWESGAWQYAGSNGSAIDYGHSLELASSPDGTLYASFMNNNGHTPAVLKLEQNEWSKLGGTNVSSVVAYTSDIAVGTDGKVYVIYEDSGNQSRATLRTYDGTAWSDPEIASGMNGNHPGLAMGSDGKLLLAYANGEDGYYLPLVKRRAGTGNWAIWGGFPFTHTSGYYMAIQSASDGSIYLAYNSGNSEENGRTNVFRFDGTSWSDIGSWPSNKDQKPELAIDPTDQKPVIAYLDRPVDGGKVHVKKWDGSAWVEIGEASELAAGVDRPSLAVGSDGTTYLAYLDTNNDNKPTVLGFLPETNPPVITAQTPASGAADAPTDAGLTLTFNEAVSAVAGKTIEICPGGSDCEQIDAGSARVMVTGNTATIAPSDEWAVNTVYTVNVEAGSFTDLNGNPAAAVTGWSFTTSATPTDSTKPRIANATVNRNGLLLAFTEPLIMPEGRSFGISDFTVRVNDAEARLIVVSEVADTNQLHLVLEQSVVKSDVVTVAYIGGADITDEAGNALDANPVAVTNTSPGAFQTPPQLLMNMKASHGLRAGEAIVRFAPSVSGAIHVDFSFPTEMFNAPALHTESIVMSDFIIKDITIGTEYIPQDIAVFTYLYKIYLVLPDGVSLTQGHTYELAMSASAAGDEIVLPGNPTTNAMAFLATWNPGINSSDALEEYPFIPVVIGEKEPVDLTALTAAISAAQAKHDAAVEGEANGNYEAGSKAELQTAIDAAATIEDDEASTQAQVNAAVTALNAAVKAFENKKIVSGGTPGGGGGGSLLPAPSTYSLNISFGGGKAGTLTVKRTTDSNGRITDLLDLTDTLVEQAVKQLHAAGMDQLIVLIPASQSAAHELALTLPVKAAAQLGSVGLSLVIQTPEATMSIPSASLQEVDEALTFTISPVRSAADQSAIEQRANHTTDIQAVAGDGEVSVIGQPVEMNTNLQQREVTLTLPLTGDQALEDVGVYIEHSDGTRELVRGRIVESNDGPNTRSILFEVNKFSTFAIVSVEGWTEHEQSQSRTVSFINAPYISGNARGVFKPSASLTRAEMAAVLARIIDGKFESKTVSFTDVPANHWASGAIEEVVALGMMNGYPDGAFRPEKSVTRAEMAAILSKLPIGVDSEGEAAGSFSDTASHWAEAAIRQAHAAGLLTGYEDGTFRPDQALTRAEAVTIINKLIGLRTGESKEPLFTDVPQTHWAFEAIQAAAKE